MFQVKMGRRHMVMPGARIKNTVVRMLTPFMTEEIAIMAMPRIHRSGPTPGESRISDSGGYAVQPMAAAWPADANPASRIRMPAPTKK